MPGIVTVRHRHEQHIPKAKLLVTTDNYWNTSGSSLVYTLAWVPGWVLAWCMAHALSDSPTFSLAYRYISDRYLNTPPRAELHTLLQSLHKQVSAYLVRCPRVGTCATANRLISSIISTIAYGVLLHPLHPNFHLQQNGSPVSDGSPLSDCCCIHSYLRLHSLCLRFHTPHHAAPPASWLHLPCSFI